MNKKNRQLLNALREMGACSGAVSYVRESMAGRISLPMIWREVPQLDWKLWIYARTIGHQPLFAEVLTLFTGHCISAGMAEVGPAEILERTLEVDAFLRKAAREGNPSRHARRRLVKKLSGTYRTAVEADKVLARLISYVEALYEPEYSILHPVAPLIRISHIRLNRHADTLVPWAMVEPLILQNAPKESDDE